MKNIFTGLSLLVSVLHFYFMALESYFWTKPLGMKVFRMTAEQAQSSKVLALNQGFYNGILAAGILWGLMKGQESVTVFCLVAILVAGIVGALSVNIKILFIQSVPALLALVVYFLLQNKSGTL